MKITSRIFRFRLTRSILFGLSFAFAISTPAFAENWSRSQVLDFHRLIAAPPSLAPTRGITSLVLPVSAGRDQGRSGLCWAYATFNILESNFLITHPHSTLSLSRPAMQYITMEDRYLRKLDGEDYINEGGAVVDAISILRKFGAVDERDYKTTLYDGIPTIVFVGTSPTEIISNLMKSLDEAFGALPARTHSALNPAQWVSLPELGNEITGAQEWIAYGSVERDQHSEGWAKHWDADARKGTQALYVKSETFPDLIKASLSAGHAVGVSWCGHSEEIYGADYDATGMASQYYVKGSYGNPDDINSFLYKAGAIAVTSMSCGLHMIR